MTFGGLARVTGGINIPFPPPPNFQQPPFSRSSGILVGDILALIGLNLLPSVLHIPYSDRIFPLYRFPFSQLAKMQNEEGQMMDLYIPRKWLVLLICLHEGISLL